MAEKLDLTIHSVGSRGDGIAETARGPVYVPYTAPGDVIEAETIPSRKGIVNARLAKLIRPGEGRGEPACRHFTVCGGCLLQHLTDDAYRSWLMDRTRAALAHHGFCNSPIAAPFITPPGSRRRVSLKALRLPARIFLGFSMQGSHKIIDLAECPVTRPELVALFGPLRDVLSRLLPEKETASVTLTASDSGIDLVLEAAFSLDLAGRENLTDFAHAHDIAAVTWVERGFEEPVIIRHPPQMNFGGLAVPMPPGAFIQATAESEEVMLEIIRQAAGDAGSIADLFCGLGTFSLPLAQNAKVFAVEGLKPLLDVLQQVAGQNAGRLKGVEIDHRDLFRNPLQSDELSIFDVILFDPPRAGAKEQVREIAASKVPTVIGISCNPNTFSRDARALVDGGYQLTKVHPIGQFLWSHHVELVGIFQKT